MGKHGDAVSRASGPRGPDVCNRIEQIKELAYAQPCCDCRYEYEQTRVELSLNTVIKLKGQCAEGFFKVNTPPTVSGSYVC